MKKVQRTFIVYVEDKPGVLGRVISLLARRAYNIDSLTVGRTQKAGVSRITLVMQADDEVGRLLEANLYKLVNVLFVQDATHLPTVIREMALIKVQADDRRRGELLQVCQAFHANVVGVTASAMMVEVTGDQSRVDGLIAVLSPFGILEMVRSGALAMTRGGETERPVAAAAGSNLEKEVA